MRTRREVDALRANLAGAKALLARLSETAVLEKFGLSRRVASLEAQLTAIEAEGGPLREFAQVALAFDGAPVRGTQGIDAEFAGEGVAEYQKLLSMVGATRVPDVELKEFGRIPEEQYCRLQIVGTVEGSFGFLLEEDPRPQPEFGPNHVSEAVEAVNELLAATMADEDAFVEAMSFTGERVRKQLAKFLKVVASHRASVKVTSTQRRVVFAATSSVQDALDRVNNATVVEADEWYVGVLEGVLPRRRRFEFSPDGRTALYGPLASTLSSATVTPFQARRCRCRIRTITVVTRGNTRIRHQLVEVLPDPTGGDGPG